MGRLDRMLGLARSVAMYHAIPFRQRRLRRLYRELVTPGSLVFDIGAHAGNRTRALVSLGCQVVAVEPQPDFARLLRALFARTARVEIVEAAACDHDGRVTLAISERTPTVTTVDAVWRQARSAESGFADVHWNRTMEIDAITLDSLIERFGVPAFVKLDVEGSESRVLAGLTRPVLVLSFEYLPTALDDVARCVARLEGLGAYAFNYSIGESYRLASTEWLTAHQLCTSLANVSRITWRAGDVYAKLEKSIDVS
jgi:FkbM family methyltransferase